MRHGYLSDTQAKDQSEPVARGITADTLSKCPFVHYDSLYADQKGRIRRGAPSDSDVARDQEAMKKIADARSSGVDGLPRDDHGGIPAGYTYFGQLVVHDLTHSVAIEGRDRIQPPLENLRTPSLDLDTIYGGGPRRCPHLYQPPYVKSPPVATDDGQHLFYLGRTKDAAPPRDQTFRGGQPLDLPRIGAGSSGIAETLSKASVMPLVNDERNDDNLILSQLTTQFLRAHNAVADYLDQHGDPNAPTPTKLERRECFALARHFMLRAYRQAVVHDYLKQLLFPSTHGGLLAGTIQDEGDATAEGETKGVRLPIEFVFGAARVGHAMVRTAYTVNEQFGPEASTLDRLMAFSASTPGADLPVPADWVVKWSNLLVMKAGDRPQSARRISPFLAPVFVNGSLRTRHTGLKGSLSFHDLWRCVQFNVPTGQDCARSLLGKDHKDVLKGGGMLPPPPFIQLHPAGNLIRELNANPEFLEQTPLSYYLLQEAASIGGNGRFMGPPGSHIYAIAIQRALKPSGDYTPPKGKSRLTLADILSPKGISTLPELVSVPDLDKGDLRTAIINTLH